MKEIKLSSTGELLIKFPYDPDLVNKVKQVGGAKWDKQSYVWRIMVNPSNAESITKFAAVNGFDVAPAVREAINKITAAVESNISASSASAADIDVVGLGGELMPFQKAGVAYASQTKRCFIGDEMGLGKTVQALAALHHLNAYPAIVICPASLKYNWEREAKKWLPGKSVIVMNGGKVEDIIADIVILNYDIVKKWQEKLLLVGAKAIVLDESHYLKNGKAIRTKVTAELVKNIPIRLCLTGTPVMNRPSELISQLKILGRLDELGGFMHFAKRYCNMHQTKWGMDMSGASNLMELNQKLRASCYVRRQKIDVLPELPAKQRTVVDVEIDNKAEYRKAKANIVSWLKSNAIRDKSFHVSLAGKTESEIQAAKNQRAEDAGQKAQRAEQLVKIETLKKIAVDGKMAAIEEWVEDFLETGEKLVLFAHHRDVVKRLADKFNAVQVIGGDDAEDRQKAVDKFQNDPDCKIIVCSLQAGGVGITLTASSNVAFVELGWTPAIHDQAEDRTHRIGQKDSVNAWYLLGKGTIDEDINALIDRKRQVVNAVTDGNVEQEKTSILDDLIDKIVAGGE